MEGRGYPWLTDPECAAPWRPSEATHPEVKAALVEVT
jgi:hypothetical protein